MREKSGLWIRIDLMRIRIWIRIQQLKLTRIHVDQDPDPQTWEKLDSLKR
jgi:hypothetical protein